MKPIKRMTSLAPAMALLGLISVVDAAAQSKQLKDVTYLLTATSIEVSSLPYGVLAQHKGWFEEEGLNVTLQTVSTGGQGLQLILADQAQIVFLAPDQLILASQSTPTGVKMFHPLVRKGVFGGIVKAGSSIESYCDLAGKTVGLPSFATSLTAYITTRMAECGLSIDAITQVETGFGVTSAQALDSGSVDMYVGFPAQFVIYETAGYDFRRLPAADWQAGLYGVGYGATESFMEQNPDVIEKFSRVLAKSAVYIRANPEDTVRSLWAAYPERAPRSDGDVAAAIKRDVAILTETMNMMRVDEYPPEFHWGSQDAETWQRHIDQLKATGQLPQDSAAEPQTYFTNRFNEAANQFDRAEVIAAARRAQ